MATPSLTELYLAWRQAKTALYFERRGVGLVDLAQYEAELPVRLEELQALLSDGSWFDQLDVGEVWIVPKRLNGDSADDGVVRVGTTAKASPPVLDVQIRLSPSPAFAIAELLYLRHFGPVLDGLLSKKSIGYRLDLRNGELDATRRWTFEYWPRRYQEFRSAPLNHARAALRRASSSVMVVSADLASFYDSIDPSFLLSEAFLARLMERGLESPELFERATRSLLAAFGRFRAKAESRLGVPVRTGVPIGSLTSRVVANLSLSTLDEHIKAQPSVLSYRRYVDDLVVVASAPESVTVDAALSQLLPLRESSDQGFNLDVEDRVEVMQKLLDGETPSLNGKSESVRNIANRYENIGDYFPEELTDQALPYFVDWLLENVHLVEIQAYSDEDAYTIFETMNDRGLSLSLPEMLKGYVLANVQNEDDQRAVNTIWKDHMLAFKNIGDDEDADFFKNWLRARYADTFRSGQKGAENQDYERIGSEFHRWVRDHKERIGLDKPATFVRFVKTDLDFYGLQARKIRNASSALVDGWESVFYNQDRGFTLQDQALLAPLRPDDSDDVVHQKVRLVADFLDIWLARRVWNSRTIAYSSVKNRLFLWTKELRHRNVAELSDFLRGELDKQEETFASQPKLRLHQHTYRQIRHILARLTHWVDTQCGLPSHFEDFVSQGRARPFEIEHIWADHYDRFTNVFKHPTEFDNERNLLGGLLLLQRGLNQSLGDATYEAKRDAYVTKGENLLARSLHPAAYTNNPGFRKLIDRTGLPFRAYESFGPEEQAERQELYIRLAEWVWNPSRLDLDGEKPPVHQPIVDPEESKPEAAQRPDRHDARQKFWQALLPVARDRHDLHKNISPGKYHWAGARKHGQWWNYVVLMDETRVELYIDGPEAADNKAVFDALATDRPAVEDAFGAELLWQRLDEKRASRVSFTVPGGWADEATWPGAVEMAVDAMHRLYGALASRVEALHE